MGQVIPIPKILTPKELDEFRPISLLNLYLKIFEKLLKTKIMDFFDKYNRLYYLLSNSNLQQTVPPN